MERPVALLEDLGAVLQDQDRGAPHGADVDRLIGRVEDQYPAGGRGALRRPAGPGQREDRAWFYVTRLGRVGHARPYCHVALSLARAVPRTSPARGARRRGADRLERLVTGGHLRALEVDEEEVVPEAGAARARLDPREVHPAAGELGAARRRASRATGRRRPRRRSRSSASSPASPTSPAGASQTKRVTLSGWSSTFSATHVAAVELRGEARAERDARGPPSGRPSGRRPRSRARSRARRAAGARAGSARTARWPEGARPRARPPTSGELVAGDHAVVDRVDHLRGDPHAVGLDRRACRA